MTRGQARSDQPEDFGSNLGGQGILASDHFGEVSGKKVGITRAASPTIPFSASSLALV